MKRCRLIIIIAEDGRQQPYKGIALTLLGASKVTVGKLAYRMSAQLHKTGSWV